MGYIKDHLRKAGGEQRAKKTVQDAVAAVKAYCAAYISEEAPAAIQGAVFKNGALAVRCSAMALRQELEQFHRAPLLDAVRQAAPAVARIQIDPA